MVRKVLFGIIGMCLLLAALQVSAQRPGGSSNSGNITKNSDAARAQKLASEGDEFMRQKDYRSAISKYGEALRLAPNYPYANFWKGYAHYDLDEYDQALTHFNAAYDQGYTPIDIYKVRWYVNYVKSNYDTALSDLLQGAKLEPSSSYYPFAMGDVYRAKGSFADSIAAYKKVIQMEPTNQNVSYFLALSYKGAGESLQQGFAALDAIKKGTKYLGESWRLVGEALQINKKPEEAAQSYEKALNFKPDQIDLYNVLSDLYRSLNRFDDAINVANRGLKQAPNNGDFYTSLSWYYSLADRPQESITAGREAVRLTPDQSMAHTNLCRAYNDSKQYDLAIQSCNNALRLKPSDGESYFYLARAYDFKNQPAVATKYYAKAVVGLEESTANNTEYSDGYYLLGNAYFAEKKYSNAVVAYKRCLELAPRFAKARYNLGYIYTLTANKPGAREQYDLLAQIDVPLSDKLMAAIIKMR